MRVYFLIRRGSGGVELEGGQIQHATDDETDKVRHCQTSELVSCVSYCTVQTQCTQDSLHTQAAAQAG